ncbi:MAG: DNA glycosylase [Chitinispirillales bacterium]|jgi:G:T/U-mismatch repair DNA glycosylase|nr:DNA glycosylase [Chitinispirillales bacterium]
MPYKKPNHKSHIINVEKHPLSPFFPSKAKWLFLGSFPPGRQRWSMEFFYPNFQNDMWRIFGLVFFENKDHFVNVQEKTFKKEDITLFLEKRHIAMYDTAQTVIRHKNNASDKELEIIQATDMEKIVKELSHLQNIVVTGQKALETLTWRFAEKNVRINSPAVGTCTPFIFENRDLRLYRMPSSSRAYPLALEKKAAVYKKMFEAVL